MRLTKSAIDRFVYRGDGTSRDVRWDDAVSGLGLRVYPSGRKAFVLSYRYGTRKRLMTLGDFDPIGSNLDEFRKRARRQITKLEDGLDPLEEKRRVTQGKSFGELLDRYISDHAKRHKLTWRKDERRFELYIPNDWRGRKASAITYDDIADLHRRVGDYAPYEANRLVEILRKAFNLAAKWHYVEPSAPNPARGVERYKEVRRKRWVRPDEVGLLARAIDSEPNVYVRAAIWLYLLTGLRRSELLRSKWADVDWGQRQLRLVETKAGEEQTAPLSAPAILLLQSIPRLVGNDYILPGARTGQHLVNVGKPWLRIRKAAGIDDVRLHDLRRTVGSWMSQSRVDLNTIKEALRHASISTTLTYARLGADPARDAIEDLGRRMLAAAGKDKPAEVVHLKR